MYKIEFKREFIKKIFGQKYWHIRYNFFLICIIAVLSKLDNRTIKVGYKFFLLRKCDFSSIFQYIFKVFISILYLLWTSGRPSLTCLPAWASAATILNLNLSCNRIKLQLQHKLKNEMVITNIRKQLVVPIQNYILQYKGPMNTVIVSD